jgi:hypothetical protein
MTIGVLRSSILLQACHLVLCHGTSRTRSAVIISFLCDKDMNGRTSTRDTSIGWAAGVGGAVMVLVLFFLFLKGTVYGKS